VVQRILRHTDVSITTSVYGHLVVEDLRGAVDRLPAGPTATDVPAGTTLPAAFAEAMVGPAQAPPVEVRAHVEGEVEVVPAWPAPFGTRLVPGSAEKAKPPNRPGGTGGVRGLRWRAIQDSNLWPLAPEANALSS
jgi:hypothetical protein